MTSSSSNKIDLRCGNSLELLQTLPDNSVDACVTDPPYELGFMGKSWDKSGIAYSVELWREVLRVLKPGGHLLAFGGTRTYHRMACAIEDAGFEIRDQMQWLYGSGFPKSLDVSKAIDKVQGESGTFGDPKSAAHAGWIDRGRMRGGEGHEGYQRPWMQDEAAVNNAARQYIPATDAAQEWQGWGTALKPANEPICVARKPLSEKTVAANVLRWGTGGLNIDAGRIGTGGGWNGRGHTHDEAQWRLNNPDGIQRDAGGRWPANVLLDEDAACELDRQSGTRKSGFMPASQQRKASAGLGGYSGGLGKTPTTAGTYGDKGGASRFFYVAKASKAERRAGCEQGNHHPTVKPVRLMRYLIALVTPPGGTVLEPFLGSGTTAVAAVQSGFGVIGFELSVEYFEIAQTRVNAAQQKGQVTL